MDLGNNNFLMKSDDPRKRTFTTKELAEIFDVMPEHINCVKCHLGLDVKKEKHNGTVRLIYDYSNYLAIKQWFDIQKTNLTMKEKAAARKKIEINTITEEHPLVTDPNFLKLEFFPDVEPKCFEDLEAD